MLIQKLLLYMLFHVIIKLYLFGILLVFTFAYTYVCLLKWFNNDVGFELKVNIILKFNHSLSEEPLPSSQSSYHQRHKLQHKIKIQT